MVVLVDFLCPRCENKAPDCPQCGGSGTVRAFPTRKPVIVFDEKEVDNPDS